MIDTDDDDWSPPDESGLASCRRHPAAERFELYRGCPGCEADPPQHDERPPPTPEADRLVSSTGALEADASGVLDMFALELRADRVIRDARREAAACRKLAREHEARARSILSGAIASTEPERDAVKWFGEATKIRALLAKNIDSEGKVIKCRLPVAIERWRAKGFKERAQLVARVGVTRSH